MCAHCRDEAVRATATAIMSSIDTMPVEATRENLKEFRLHDLARALDVVRRPLKDESKESREKRVAEAGDWFANLSPARLQSLRCMCHYVGDALNIVNAATTEALTAHAAMGNPEAYMYVMIERIEIDNARDEAEPAHQIDPNLN